MSLLENHRPRGSLAENSVQPVAAFRPRLGPRLASAIRRRAAYAWRRLTWANQTSAAEAAFGLLTQHGDGVPAVGGDSAGCPGVTGGAIETAWPCGARDVVQRWTRWLASSQRPDGSWAESKAVAPSLVNTAWAARGLLAVEPHQPEVQPAVLAACRFLCLRLDELLAAASTGGLRAPPAIDHAQSAILYPVWQAARRFKHAQCRETVRRFADDCVRSASQAGPIRASHGLAALVEMLIELDRYEAAAGLMGRLEKQQRRNGALPVLNESRRTPVATLAHLAACWYRLGRRDPGDRIMRCLTRWHGRAKGPHGVFGPPGREDAWAAKHYLDAARLQVQTAFDVASSHLPERIDPADGRVQAVHRWFETLPRDARVADVGCGSGRFLRYLIDEFPRARLTGIDVSTTMLAGLPRGVTPLQGSLLHVDMADDACDGAFAVESLEHALLPRQAVGELCRIVRPGGRVLIIDKHRARQPLSQHDPWERWFTPAELSDWLGGYCNDVSVQAVSHSEGRPGSNLFLAATGTRHKAHVMDVRGKRLAADRLFG